jgi:hypothetical protein
MQNEAEASNVKAGVDRSFPNDIDATSSTRRAVTRLSLAPRLLILGVCTWSLIEMPAEFDPSAGDLGVAALAIAKIAWTVIGIAAARGIRRAQWIFSFLCGLSLVAIVPGLPVELHESAWIFTQSLVECLLKAGALLSLSLSPAARPTTPS